MTEGVPSTIHASAVLVGARAMLIRGPPGAGKSRLALGLIEAARTRQGAFARLVADDRTGLTACHGRLLARPAPILGGLLEIRGIGVCRLPYEPVAVVGMVIDLAADGAERLPSGPNRETVIEGIRIPRLSVAPGDDPMPLVLAQTSISAARLDLVY